MTSKRRRSLRKRFEALVPVPSESRWRGFKRSFVRKTNCYYSAVEQRPMPIHKASGDDLVTPEQSAVTERQSDL